MHFFQRKDEVSDGVPVYVVKNVADTQIVEARLSDGPGRLRAIASHSRLDGETEVLILNPGDNEQIMIYYYYNDDNSLNLNKFSFTWEQDGGGVIKGVLLLSNGKARVEIDLPPERSGLSVEEVLEDLDQRLTGYHPQLATKKDYDSHLRQQVAQGQVDPEAVLKSLGF